MKSLLRQIFQVSSLPTIKTLIKTAIAMGRAAISQSDRPKAVLDAGTKFLHESAQAAEAGIDLAILAASVGTNPTDTRKRTYNQGVDKVCKEMTEAVDAACDALKTTRF